MPVGDVSMLAKQARNAGADRFCMGAAWRQVRDGAEFDAVLDMVRGVRALGMEACVTLGMLTEPQAQRLKEAGLTAYNHNLDTGPDYYSQIISTRTYDDRLATLRAVRAAGIEMCCGGIIGMGESVRDRAAMLAVLAGFDPHPESVPINALVAVRGNAACRPREDRSVGFRAHGCDGANCIAAQHRAAFGWPRELQPRSTSPLHDCRRQFDFLWRYPC